MKPHDEDGQVLLLALGFLVFFGLVIGALMSFVGANVFTTERLREQRETAYAVDGAMDAAIQIGRTDPAVGAFGVPADQCMHTSQFTVTAGSTAVTVSCVANQAALSDRDVTFSATVSGNKMIVAEVRYYDSVDSMGTPPVEVLNWTYCGHDSGTCP